jgi:molybdopterin synthase sulfur carrier subunit
MIRLLYFSWVRERIGFGEEEIDLPSGIASMSALIDWLATTSSAHRNAFADRARLRAAIDGEFVGLDADVRGAREIAIFPPVTGG